LIKECLDGVDILKDDLNVEKKGGHLSKIRQQALSSGLEQIKQLRETISLRELRSLIITDHEIKQELLNKGQSSKDD
jgi:hypothetical protein